MKTNYLSTLALVCCIIFACEEPDITIEAPDIIEEALDCSRTDTLTTASTSIEYEYQKKDYYNIDQTIRFSKLAPDMSWLINVHFDGDTEGYIGFRSDANGETQITFSMTNATICRDNVNNGSFCEDDIDNEIRAIRIDHPVVLNDEYRIRIWRLGDGPGIETDWGVFIRTNTEYSPDFDDVIDENGNNEEYIYVGTITATNATVLTGSTTMVSFNGFSYGDLNCMPQSTVYFSAPTANHDDRIRSFNEKAMIGDINTDTNLNTVFKRYTSNGVFEGVEVTVGNE